MKSIEMLPGATKTERFGSSKRRGTGTKSTSRVAKHCETSNDTNTSTDFKATKCWTLVWEQWNLALVTRNDSFYKITKKRGIHYENWIFCYFCLLFFREKLRKKSKRYAIWSEYKNHTTYERNIRIKSNKKQI